MAGSALAERSHDVPLRRPFLWPLAVAAAIVGFGAPAVATAIVDDEAPVAGGRDPEAKVSGMLIRVPLPITGNVDNRVKGMIQRAQSRLRRDDARPVLVLEFAPRQGEFGADSDFARALSLARFLTDRQLRGIKTVAYLPRSIKGHAVLVAMACEEIVMHPDAEIGEAGIAEPAERPIAPVVLSGYREIANGRRTIPTPIALGMLDKRLEVLEVETEVSVEYVLRENLEKLRKGRAVQSEEVLIPRGEMGDFSGRRGRELGFVKYLASDRGAVAKALELTPEALEDDPSLGGAWNAVLIKIEGPIKASVVGQLQSLIQDEVRQGEMNFLCVEIDSPGGALEESLQLANFLAGLDPASVRTVAYVPHRAQDDAALIALACDHLVMQPDAILGGQPTADDGGGDADERNVAGADEEAEDRIVPARQSIRKVLAARKGRSWSLLEAFVDPDLKVYRYENKKSGAVDFFCAEELGEQKDADDWVQREEVTPNAKILEVDGTRASELGLASDLADSFVELKQLYGLESDPRRVEPSWADFLIDALARDEFAVLLLVLGGVAIYAELQAPGIGIGGFVASVCFMVFFWSKFLNGTADWLEVMLFLGGVCFLLLEIFVLPGFGIFGLGGGLLIIASLVLASQTFVFPTNEEEITELRNSMLVVGGAGVGIVAIGVAIRRFLPHAPMFNRILLAPPQGAQLENLAAREAIVDFAHLIGQSGVTTTQLTPSGKARFNDELIDVIADGEAIERGTPIVVVEVRGNRVLVQAVVRR